MNKEIRIDLGKCWNALVKKMWLMVCCAVASLAIFSIVSEYVIKEEYSASATVYSMSYASLTDSLTGANAISAYANLVTSRKVAEGALAYISGDYNLTDKQIMRMISVSTTANDSVKVTEKLTITASSSDAGEAIVVANAVANAFVYEMQSLTGTNTIQILDSAQDANVSNSNLKVIIRLLGAMLGAAIPFFVVLFKEIFSDVVYRIDDATCDNELELLAIIPSFDNK